MRLVFSEKNVDTVEEYWNRDIITYSINKANQDSLTEFRVELGQFLTVDEKNIHFMPSGHQGLEWLLCCRCDTRRLVMAPAFNCSVVEDAIRAAGYQLQLYDFSPTPGQFDWERVIREMDSSVGVLIVTHYFGVPVDFRPIIDYCSANGIAIIEDCAHLLGGTIGGRQAGTLGDASIFSFNYDKPISLGWGGFALINNYLAFDGECPSLHRTPSYNEEIELLSQFVEAMTTRRRMIPYQNSLILRILQRSRLVKSVQFCNEQTLSIGAVQAELGRWCLAHYREVMEHRNRNAITLAAGVKQTTWPVSKNVTPAWLKQKLLIQDTDLLKIISIRCQKRGLRCGNFNWPELINGNNSARYLNAEEVASQWLDVPIHQNMDKTKFAELLELL